MINLKKVFSSNAMYSYSTELDKQDSSVLGNFIPIQAFEETSSNTMQPYMVSGELYLNSGFNSRTKQNGAFSPTSSAL